MSPTKRIHRGFTAIEALLAIGVGALVAAGLFIFLRFMVLEYMPETLVHAGVAYGSTPSQSQLGNAMLLHTRLLDFLDDANEIYVFGGAGQDSAQGSAVVSQTVRPIIETWRPNQLNPLMDSSLASAARRPNPFVLGQALAANFEPTNAAGDFTLVTVSGRGAVTSVTQVRRQEAEGNALYRTSLWVAASNETLSYGCYLPVAQDAWTLQPGATTYWYGNAAADGYGRFDVPVYRMTFPDPGVRPAHGVNPYSRFTYLRNGNR